MGNMLFAPERRRQILALLDENKRVDVNDLSARFGVSSSTIRTDLKELEAQGLLMRTFGGAIEVDSGNTLEDKPYERKITEEKRAIAKEAVKYIQNGDVIAIDTGTSCQVFAEELVKKEFKDLSILTYDLKIALHLSENTTYRVQVPGGLIRNNYPYVSSGSVLGELSNFSVDKTFIATNAFDFDFGFSTPNYETSEIKKGLLRIAKERIVLCDSPKINKRFFCCFASLKDCDLLIVDSNISEKDVIKLKESNVNFKVAK